MFTHKYVQLDVKRMNAGLVWMEAGTCFLAQPLLQGVQVRLAVLLVDFHLLDELLLRLPAEGVVLLASLVQDLLHVLPLLSQLL